MKRDWFTNQGCWPESRAQALFRQNLPKVKSEVGVRLENDETYVSIYK